MSGHDLDALLRSPLDDGDGGRSGRWLPAAAAAASALVVFAVLIVTVGGEDAAGDGEAATTTTTTPTVVEVRDPFPAGYTPIEDDLAVKAFPAVDTGAQVLVPLAMAVRRGVSPDDATPPLASIWVTAAGVRSTHVITDPARPGAMSAAFPPGTAVGAELRLVELWSSRAVEVESTVDFSGIPFDLADPIVHDLGEGVSLTIERVELRNLLAEVEWSIAGTELAGVEIALVLLLDDGSLLEEYSPTLHGGEPATSGLIRYVWPFGIRVDQDEASMLQVRAAVTIGAPVPADVTVSVPGS